MLTTDANRSEAAARLAGKIASKKAPNIDSIRLGSALARKHEPRLCMANEGVFVQATSSCAVNGEGDDIITVHHNYTAMFDNLSDAMSVATEMYNEPDGDFKGADFQFYNKDGYRIG